MESGNLIQQGNLNLLRSLLRTEHTATKPKLAQLSGLSVVTVQSLIKILLQSGEITQNEIVQPRLGRPAVSYCFNERARLGLVIFMYEKNGKDTAKFLVCDLYGQCVEQAEQTFERVTAESYDCQIAAILKKYENIEVIVFGMPVQEVHGEIVISDYPNLRSVNFAERIHAKTGRKVIVENDMNAAVLGYCRQNRIEENSIVIGIYMPSKYPPGAGIYCNGMLVKGRNGLAGEIKYLPLGVDWDTFDYDRQKTEDYLMKAIQVFLCTYNPDKVVVYWEQNGRDIEQKLKESCRSAAEHEMLPQIEKKNSITQDIESGVIALALKQIL